ncbi:hypothetical protein Tco_0925381 [Tanacetum coccineum]|uniref:Uncharacterized protein n=1 Tax=Tanacetum coccineum TaxID=301880 RepID=A0ABQ5D7K5_9ASTR
MVDWVSIVETDKVIYTVDTDIVKLVVEIEIFGMSSDEFDKKTRSSDGLQPKQVDMRCVHALNELHLHEINVPSPSLNDPIEANISEPSTNEAIEISEVSSDLYLSTKYLDEL